MKKNRLKPEITIHHSDYKKKNSDEIIDESLINPDKIEAPESSYLYTDISQLAIAGKGLYTAIDIYKDEIIAIYKGEILTASQAKYRANKKKDQYFINLLDGSIMDSMKKNCFAKFANDATAFSDSKFRNNARISLDEVNNVCLIATRKIRVGEEIFCSYGKRYWKKNSEK